MRSADPTLDAIAASYLFRSLESAPQRRLAEAAIPSEFAAGQVILREGDPGCSLYLIASGSVQVSTMAEGERVVLAELNPGACFGEVSLLSGGPRTATVMVTSPCRVLRLEQATVEAELQDDPKLRQRLTSMVQGRARDTIEKII